MFVLILREDCHEELYYKMYFLWVQGTVINDRFHLPFFVAMCGFRESGWLLSNFVFIRTKSRPCVYISTPLKRYQNKNSATCAWSIVQVFCGKKSALIHVRTTKAQISLRVRTDWSAPLLFAIARSFSTEKPLTSLYGGQNDFLKCISFS